MENWHDSFKDIQGCPKISSHFLGEFQASKTKSLISMIIDRRGVGTNLMPGKLTIRVYVKQIGHRITMKDHQ